MLMIKRHVQSLIDKGAFTKAIGVAAEHVRRNPDSATGHQLVAMAEEAAGYTKAAIQTISHAIDLAPEEPSNLIMRARLLIKDHRIKEAIADVEIIITTSDPRRDAHLLSDAMACRDDLLERQLNHAKGQSNGNCLANSVFQFRDRHCIANQSAHSRPTSAQR
jgi:protein involved in temperature-dependent protein secretion